MKGFVETPPETVDLMVEKLFVHGGPMADQVVLDPGCGRGAFIAGILRYCDLRGLEHPRIVAVDLNPEHVAYCRRHFAHVGTLTVHYGDFLTRHSRRYDFIVGNPPYVSITGISTQERETYRRAFQSAANRFDLYILFFEQALRLLTAGGRLVFITPEKFVFTAGAARIRSLLATRGVEELHYLHESTFGGLTTYPLVTTVDKSSDGLTLVIPREGHRRRVRLSSSGASWLPQIHDTILPTSDLTLADAALRISCGVATGADSVFVLRDSAVPMSLRTFARPTVSGRQLRPELTATDSILLPYALDGALLPEIQLGPLHAFLSHEGRKDKLLARTCVARKPWYAFHETPPLQDLLRPKILCKDISQSPPRFVADYSGELIPRHSVYYIVPRKPGDLSTLLAYLNSLSAQTWLANNCQRAANGFLRVQSHILKRLPLPKDLALEGVTDLLHSATA